MPLHSPRPGRPTAMPFATPFPFQRPRAAVPAPARPMGAATFAMAPHRRSSASYGSGESARLEGGTAPAIASPGGTMLEPAVLRLGRVAAESRGNSYAVSGAVQLAYSAARSREVAPRLYRAIRP